MMNFNLYFFLIYFINFLKYKKIYTDFIELKKDKYLSGEYYKYQIKINTCR